MLKISKLPLDQGSMVIDEEGYLWAWGHQGSGGLGLGDTTTRYFPVKVGDKTWSQITRGSAGQTLAIDTEGHLWACGNNEYGQLGLDDTENRNQFEQIGDKTWTQVSCGWNFTLAIDTEGHLWAWGDNRWGQLGTGTTFDEKVPTQIGDKTWSQVSCGSSSHTLAIDTEGHLWGCGTNGQGELGLGDETNRSSLTQIGDKTWSQVSCGNDFTLAIDTEGHLWAWGCNDFGQLGLGDTNDRSIPIQVGDKIWTQISCGTQFSMAIDTENQLWVWGTNGSGQLARNSFHLRFSEIPLEITTDNLADPGFPYSFNGWKAIHASGSSAFAIDTWGYLWVWGYGRSAQLGLGDTNDRSRATFNRIIVSISDRLSFILRQIGIIQTAKSRIQEKFELPDDLDFLSYSEFIKGSSEFYKCAAVGNSSEDSELPENTWNGYKATLTTKEETIEIDGTGLIVSGAGTEGANGTYELQDPNATGYNRVWKKVGDPQYDISYMEDSYWIIGYIPEGDEMNSQMLYITSQLPVPENPDNTPWEPWGNGVSPAPEVTKTEGGTETKTIKYYEFAETLTNGLTYGYGFTPEVGKIYDAEAMVEAKLILLKEKVPFRLTAAQNNAYVQLNANGTVDSSQLYYRTFIDGTLTDWALYQVGTGITLPTMNVDYVEFENRQEKFSTDANNYFSFRFYGNSYTKVSPSGDIMSLHGYTEECTPYCFYSLFKDTYGLVGEITLSATKLATSCYQHMMNSGQSGDEGLAVNIMATTLADNAMNNLMANCGTITSIRVKFTEWQPDNAFSNWVYFPAGFNGNFYKPAALPDERGSSRIPYNATVVDE